MGSGQTIAITVALLAASNLFMTFTWYGHLKYLGSSPWYAAALSLMGAVYFTFFA